MNITDVDDKIINRAKERNMHPLELARLFEKYFYEDMEALNIKSVNLYARASEYLKEIYEQIQGLIEKGYAYETETGVYFDISKFKDYGKLSGRKIEELVVHRIEPDPTKRNPGDFALWRKRPKDELGWESPWGWGRPGWHIEDTAISIKHFGKQYDIHGGAIELSFPHHEAEIAQAEAFTGVKPFVKYWVHSGLLTVEGEKMSKSLGNFITIRDALERYDADTLRLFLLSAHYRSPLDFSWTLVEQAKKNINRIKNTLISLEELKEADKASKTEEILLSMVDSKLDDFINYLLDDINTPSAIATMLSLTSEVNKYIANNKEITREGKNKIKNVFKTMFNILGILEDFDPSKEVKKEDSGLLESLMKTIIELRQRFREKKDWETADWIRNKLREIGIELIDTPEGTKWRLKT